MYKNCKTVQVYSGVLSWGMTCYQIHSLKLRFLDLGDTVYQLRVSEDCSCRRLGFGSKHLCQNC